MRRLAVVIAGLFFLSITARAEEKNESWFSKKKNEWFGEKKAGEKKAPDAPITDEDAKQALLKFKKAYAVARQPAKQADAVTDLSAAPHKRTLPVFLTFVMKGAVDVRVAAAEGLAGFGEFKRLVVPTLIKALAVNKKEPDVRIAIFETLGKLGDEKALPVCHKTFEDKDTKVAAAALLAAADIRSVKTLGLIINLMAECDKQSKRPDTGRILGQEDPKRKRGRDLLKTTIEAAQRCAKEKWSTVADWKEWWKRRRATFKIEKE